MSWEVVLVLVGYGILLSVVIALGVLLRVQSGKTKVAMANEQRWRTKYQNAMSVLKRTQYEKEAAELSDREMADALSDIADNWVPGSFTDDSTGEI